MDPTVLPWGLLLASFSSIFGASLATQMVKNLPAVQETWLQPLSWEDPLGKGTATHSSIFAWRIPWTEEPVTLSAYTGAGTQLCLMTLSVMSLASHKGHQIEGGRDCALSLNHSNYVAS